jgi:hypothetical protein
MAARRTVALSLSLAAFACSQEIPLTVPPGTPLRVYLTKRVPKRVGAPVEARLISPVYAFDREVIPAGTPLSGRVSRIGSVSKWERTRAAVGGDFTPLHIAQVEFTSYVSPDGRPMPLHTLESTGLNSLFPLHPPKQRKQNPQNNGSGIGSAAKDQINAQVARVKSIPEMVRGRDKKEWMYDFLMSKLPYHPQSVHNRTRFDAELLEPLDFGSETAKQESLVLLGSQPSAGSIAHARLLTPLDSGSSKNGEIVEAILTEPLFSSDRRLILPEGTQVNGSVVLARRARWFHRGGRLRFSFQSVVLTPVAAQLGSRRVATEPEFRTQATLNAAESDNAPLKVDKEGGVQAKESNTRFIGAAIAVLITHRATDNDVERHGGTITGQSSNRGGRTLGGGLGFGLLGTIAAQSSKSVGTALSYYGLAWTLYSTLIARGAEAQFGKNAVIDIGFNQRAPAPAAEPAP